MNNLPLYPQEAYSEQNNAQAFVNEKEKTPSPSFNIGQNMSPIVPLLIKLLTGGNINGLNFGGDNPLLNALSLFANNNKKTPPQSEGEKDFPN